MEASTSEAASEPVLSATSGAPTVGKPDTPMGDAIDSLTGGMPLGDSEVGKAWCLKALHPADSSVISSPMPTYETRSFASVGYNQLDTFQMPASFDPARVWNITFYVHRDPVLLYSWRATQINGGGLVSESGFVFSKQINSTTTYADSYNALRASCEKFRLTSHSLTGYFDSASQTDQGHIVCGQTDLPRLNAERWRGDNPVNDMAVTMPVTFYQDSPPSYENLLQTTKSFQGHARGGFYAPSKLINLGSWVTTNQAWQLIGSAPSQSASAIPFNSYATTFYEADESMADFAGTFPYVRPDNTYPTLMVFAQPDTSLTTIFMTNVAPTSAIRLTMRWTMDMIVRPATTYAPFTRMPPPADLNAIRMYAEVSRRMPDAYPSSYNNLGFLLPVLKSVVGTVAPAIIPRVTGWIRDRIATKRDRGGRSRLELLSKITSAERERLNQLAAMEMRTEDEQKELDDLQAKVLAPSVDVPSMLGSLATTFARMPVERQSSGSRSRRYSSRSYSRYPSRSSRSYSSRSYSRPYYSSRSRSSYGRSYKRRRTY